MIKGPTLFNCGIDNWWDAEESVWHKTYYKQSRDWITEILFPL